jgi:hypothetical protein
MGLDLNPGDKLGYGQIETVIEVLRSETRFRTVTTAWRKRLFRERGMEVKAEGGMFIGLLAGQALSSGVASVNRIAFAAGRTTRRLEVIDSAHLTADERERHMLARREVAALHGYARSVCNTISPPKALTDR